LWMVVGAGNTPANAGLVILTLFLFRQCALTFSRAGLYMATGGILAAAFYLTRDRRSRWKLFVGAAVVLPILFFVVWPRLEALTSGAIATRFGSIQTTGRDTLVVADLKTWVENPVLGAGPGMGRHNRELLYGIGAAAHTEYSRLLAEHGLLGLAALALLVAMAARNLRAAPTRVEKALAAGMLAYSILSMAVDGMRLVATSFAFGISGARLLLPRRRVAASPEPERVEPELASRLVTRAG
jgi:O-Antigen ligase